MGVLITFAAVSTVGFLLLLIFRREIVGVDLSARSLLRMYLYLASLAAVVVLAIGVSAATTWGMASAFGAESVYGRPPLEYVCPAGEKCPDPVQLRTQYLHERQQRQDQDLLRGITFTFFGLILWGAHALGRRFAAGADEGVSALRRAYLALGTFVFGLSSIVAIPFGVFQLLSNTLLTSRGDVRLEGYGDTLSIGLVALPIWLYYLLRLVRDFRSAREPAIVASLATAGRMP